MGNQPQVYIPAHPTSGALVKLRLKVRNLELLQSGAGSWCSGPSFHCLS